MSHKANAWLALLPPEAVKAGAFRILFHLCDHHNDDRDPETACFPSQETLMRKTGLSNGALNNALAAMEKDGLIARRRSTVPGSSKRRTYYILGCDGPIEPEQTPENGVSSNSSPVEAAPEQTPVSDGANSSFEASKLQPTGEYPVKEPKKDQYCAAGATHHGEFDFGSFFDRVWRVCPNKDHWAATEEAVKALIDAGEQPGDVLAATEAYRKRVAGYDPQRIKLSQNFFADDFWRAHVSAAEKRTDPQKVLEARAADIRARKPWARTILPSQAGECIQEKLITVAECRAAGINV